MFSIKTIVAALLGISVPVIGYLGYQNQEEKQEALGAFGDPFLSIQLATSPSNGECLLTDGTNNSWGACAGGGGGSTLHVDGGGFVYPQTGDYHSAPYYVATSTTASSTMPILATNYIDFATGAAYSANLGELTWNADEGTLDLGMNGGAVVNQLGQETVAYVRADEDIDNGEIVYASSAIGASGRIGVSKFTANAATSSKFVIGVATEDITSGSDGYVTIFGKIRGVQTNGANYGETWSDGEVLYASSTTGGALTNVEPNAPNQVIPIAFVINAHASNGTLMVRQPDTYNIGELHDVSVTSASSNDMLRYNGSAWVNNSTVVDYFNGSFIEPFNATSSSDGAAVTMHLLSKAGGDLTARFSTGEATITAPTSTALTAGTDALPTENYVYILESTKALTVSTTDWPSAEHVKVAYILVPSATFVQNYGTYVNQNWNDEVNDNSTNMGHLAHIAEHIRLSGAVYHSGVAGDGDAGSYVVRTDAAPDTVYLKSTAGVVFQMHRQAFAAVDTSGGDIFQVANQNGSAYATGTDLYNFLTDADGDSMSGNFYNLVLWGVANKTGQNTPIMVNLPTCSYGKQSEAEQDVDGCDVFTIPDPFLRESGTGFLIARLTMDHTAAGQNLELISTVDLRGQTPQAASGGTAAGVLTDFSDDTFTLFDNLDVTKIGNFQLSGLTAATTRTLTWPDASGTIALTSDLHDAVTLAGEDYLSLSTQLITANAINPDNLAATDFGNFTCNGTSCSIDNNSLTADMLYTVGQTDEYCATYELGSGGIEWQDCTNVTLGGTPDYITISGQLLTLGTVDIGDDTNLTAGTNITLTGDTLNVDDVFPLVAGEADYTGTHDFDGATVAGMQYYPAFMYATTTWTGTTTLPLGPAYNAQTWDGVKCFTDTGTLWVQFDDGTNGMNSFQASTTVGSVSLSTNNTFTAGEKRYVDIGTPASTPTRISCSVSYQDD